MNDLIQALRAFGFQLHPLADFGLAHYYHAERDMMIQLVPLGSFQEIQEQNLMYDFQQNISQLRSQYSTLIRMWEDVWMHKKAWIIRFSCCYSRYSGGFGRRGAPVTCRPQGFP